MKTLSLIIALFIFSIVFLPSNLMSNPQETAIISEVGDTDSPQSPYGWTDEGEFKSLKIEDDGIYSIRFSNDGTKLFVVNKDFKGYKIFDTETGSLIKEKVFDNSNIKFAKFSDDDSAVVVSSITPKYYNVIEHRVYSISSDSLLLHSIIDDYLFPCPDVVADEIGPYSPPTQSYYSIKDNTLWASFTFSASCYGAASTSKSAGRLIKATTEGDSTVTTLIDKSPIMDYIVTDDNRLIYTSYDVDTYFEYVMGKDYSGFDYRNYLNVVTLETGNIKNLYYNDMHWENDYPEPELFEMVNDVKIIEERNAFITSIEGGIFYIWSLDNYIILDSFNLPENYYTYGIYPSGKNIIGIVNHNINIYSIPNFRLIDSIAFPSDVDIRGSLAVSPDGESFVCGSLDGTVRLFVKDVISDVNDKNDITNSENLIIYPNPTDESINIKNINLSLGNIEIYSTTGVKLYEQKSNGNKNIKLDISNLDQGIYFVRFNNQFSKFVKVNR